ncbi:MAG: HEPN domain-containing protein [Firmicutes bacterium]|nr:HEPN domain-containing protein [Bacillota bacterium]
MRIDELTSAYLEKAGVRMEGLYFFRDRGAYSDVVRDAQSVVELSLKAVLRAIGVEVPKIHDVGRTLESNRDLLPVQIVANLPEIKSISKRLRKERELSFYGAEDFIPTEEYDLTDAEQAIKDASFVLQVVRQVLLGKPVDSSPPA